MIKSIDRALIIVKLVSAEKDGCSVTELADKLEINKSSVFRILSTLVAHGYIEQDKETKKYRLGYQYLKLSAKLLDSIDIRKEALPYLRQLEKSTNEVIHLVIYSQKEAVYIEKLEGNETLRMHSQIGRRAPMHCTSAGKTILAYLTKSEVLEVKERNGFPKYTENTITNLEDLFENLNEIRNKGYGIEREENELEITCIAAPIFFHQGDIAGAISISSTSKRMNDERIDKLKYQIMDVCEKVSERLGYRGS